MAFEIPVELTVTSVCYSRPALSTEIDLFVGYEKQKVDRPLLTPRGVKGPLCGVPLKYKARLYESLSLWSIYGQHDTRLQRQEKNFQGSSLCL
jgi:hypothetical protein